MEKKSEVKPVRCVIYTRKSTTEGLEKDFTSLDAQRESAESYVKSQQNQGWLLLPEKYDDGGFSGSHTDRPALHALLADIKEKKIDCVVVYKVDRLSRSLRDFVTLLQFFEEQQVTFVSVTQNFDTNSSMGRLTLNILLSFAQFEREMISERTKDKMGAARKKGRWAGGRAPLGYDLDRVNKKLVINLKEAEIIRHMFNLYLERKSLAEVAQTLNEEGYKTKTFRVKDRVTGGVPFKNTNIQLMINNATYVGKVEYGGKIYPGEHEAIITEEIFAKTRELLKQNRRERNVSKNRKFKGLLTSLFRCTYCNASMCHGYAIKRKTNHKYRYYICINAIKRGRKTCPIKSLSAGTVENKVLELLKKISNDERLNPKYWDSLITEEQMAVMRSIVKTVGYDGSQGKMVIELIGSMEKHEFDIPIYQIKAQMSKSPEGPFNQQPPIRRQLLLAHQIQQMIDKGQAQDIKQIAQWTRIERARLYQMMSLLYLAPQIQEDILFRNFEKLSKISERNVRHITCELNWQKQAALWQILMPNQITFRNQ